MNNQYIVIGVGNTGCLLAKKFAFADRQNPLPFYPISTALQDFNNFSTDKRFLVSTEGASKKFSVGKEIWKKKYATLKQILSGIEKRKVIVFFAAGGGSGSSSATFVNEILLEQGNQVLYVTVLPEANEGVSPLANAAQCVTSLTEVTKTSNVLLFDNNILYKAFSEKNNIDMESVNSYIIDHLNLLVYLLDKFDSGKYSPLTIDSSELRSILFESSGFSEVNSGTLNNGKVVYKNKHITSMTDSKSLLITMILNDEFSSNEEEDMAEVNKRYNEFTALLQKLGKSKEFKTSKIIPGVVRANSKLFNNSEFEESLILQFVNGVRIEEWHDKFKATAVEKAKIFGEKRDKVADLKLNDDEQSALDI